MHTTVEIDGKPLEVSTSREADAILSQRELPLNVEMELDFSCVLCKKVRFHVDKHQTEPHSREQQEYDQAVHINNKLSVSFRPVMVTQSTNAGVKHHPLTDFPIVNKRPYVPKWLRIDFRFGHWFGEFGYFN